MGEKSFKKICLIPDQIANNLLEMLGVEPSSIKNTFGVEVSELVITSFDKACWLVKPKNYLLPHDEEPKGLGHAHHWLLLSCDYGAMP